MKKFGEFGVWQFVICCCVLLCGASMESRAQEQTKGDELMEVALNVCTADGLPYVNAKIWEATSLPVIDTNFRTDQNGKVTFKVRPQSTLIVGEYMLWDEKTGENIPIDEYFGTQGSEYYTKLEVKGRSIIDVAVTQAMMGMTTIKPASPKKEVPVAVNDTTVVQDAQFPGGYTALSSYLHKNINYPQAALDEDVQGLVVIRFSVEKDGSIGEVQIKKGLSYECDREAVRVIKSLPRFIPAKQGDRPMRKWITVPLRFIIQ